MPKWGEPGGPAPRPRPGGFGDDTETAELRAGDDGQLLEVMVNRWGNPGGGPFRRCPFGVSVQAEAAFDGITIPARFTAGWWHGTSRQAGRRGVLPRRITHAQFG